MIISSKEDIVKLKEIGKIVSLIRDKMIEEVHPGITTLELDEIAKDILSEYGAESAPISEYNFPGYTCISINDVAAHGIPGETVIREGDIVNVDVSAKLNGYFSDTGATKVVGPIIPLRKKLCDCSERALYKALDVIKDGEPINVIGKAIEEEARKEGLTVIKNLTGHGIGRKLHEDPKNIFNYFKRSNRDILKKGMVLAVETFISTGDEYVSTEDDGWTLRTHDGSLVSQFEHTIIVTEDKPIILTKL